MDAVVVITLITLTVAGTVVITLALTLWGREVFRSRDGSTDGRVGEPSPVDGRALPLMALTALVVLGVQYLRGGELSVREAIFSAAFVGFALSAGWYLLARRSPELSRGARVQGLSVLVAGCFGLLWGLAPS